MGTQQTGTEHICPACGRALSGPVDHCYYCGVRLSDARAAAHRRSGLDTAGGAAPLAPGAVPPPGQVPQSAPPPAYHYAPPGAYASPPRQSGRKPWVIGVIIGGGALGCMVVFVLLLVGAMHNMTQVQQKAKEAEGKQNLHTIQLAVERYATDNGGAYPEYLIGGAAKYSDNMFYTPGDPEHDCTDPRLLSDPLLRTGYLNAYPANPFAKDEYGMGGGMVLSMQMMPQLNYNNPTGTDPLGNGCEAARDCGTRFGPDGCSMGQVLADLRYPEWNDPAHPGLAHTSYADYGYKMWDCAKQHVIPYKLAGEFFYKSCGPYDTDAAVAAGCGEKTPLRPRSVDRYILGLYGEVKDKGKDVLGDEQAQDGLSLKSGKPAPPVWLWTCSLSEQRAGSPYHVPEFGGELEYGNPNGVRDAVVLVLTADEQTDATAVP